MDPVNPEPDDLEVIDPALAARPPGSGRHRRPGARRGPATAVAGVVLLVVATALAGITLHLRSHHRSATPDTVVLPPPSPTTLDPLTARPDAEFVGQMGLISPGVGWALNSLALYRTVDDGAHWQSITPAGVADPIGNIDTLDFLDADHAWVAVANAAGSVTIYRTADGGRSWLALPPDECGASARLRAACGSPVSIDFIDPQRGWALFSVPRARGTLLATHDGGRTWTTVSRTQFSGRLHYIDPRDAWAVSDPSAFFDGQSSKPGGAVYRTSDGGTTWREIVLPSGEAIGSLPLAIGAPQFFGGSDVVAARLTLRPANERAIVVYRSDDGGRTWITRPAPSHIRVRFTDLADDRFSASSASDWTLLVGSSLYVTHDAGGRWQTITPTNGRLVDVDFATPSSAWLLAIATPSCDRGAAVRCTDAVLLHTTDGGTVWQPASPTIGITADRLP